VGFSLVAKADFVRVVHTVAVVAAVEADPYALPTRLLRFPCDFGDVLVSHPTTNGVLVLMIVSSRVLLVALAADNACC
jgi:hypothetical protein